MHKFDNRLLYYAVMNTYHIEYRTTTLHKTSLLDLLLKVLILIETTGHLQLSLR